MDISQVFTNNKVWIVKQLEQDGHYFEKLSKGQSPGILYIGCSDSRVTAEELMGLEPGEAFVHRNIANLVPNTDLSVMCVINYAVTVLKVSHIVICGHYGCGGILAAMQPNDMGVLNPWLRNIRDVYRLHRKELDAIENEKLRYNRLVELNVQEQCINAMKAAEVQKAIAHKELTVHGWIFDIGTGELIDLNIDFEKVTRQLADIYRINP